MGVTLLRQALLQLCAEDPTLTTNLDPETGEETLAGMGELHLAEPFGYATDLRSMTQGRGTFSLEFDRYDVVPDGLAEEVIKQRKADGKIPLR